APPAPAPVAEDASLSESLARIFIGQGRFESALEIIEGLAAKDGANPFYADQVRYLRKLVRLKSGN
ncbi:MAG: tetratricopeptide repeat protein, partial [Muribaculaceae bacterium]|nr:tetratricopeptide repeat protein [Muribaculaceae bacterium]